MRCCLSTAMYNVTTYSSKAMPLDLSCNNETSCSGAIDDDDDDKDDIIVTMSVPGRLDAGRHGPELIVIPSDSEDSDADVTIVSEFSTLGSLRGSHLGKSSAFGEVLGIPIAGPSDDPDDDCFVSFSSSSGNCGKVRGGTPYNHGVRAGIKRVFEDSSSQSSIDSPSSPLGSALVQGKDAFLSDTSSQSSAAEDLGLILTTENVKKYEADCSSGNAAKGSGKVDKRKNFSRQAFSLPISQAVAIVSSASSVKELSSAKVSVATTGCVDLVQTSSKASEKLTTPSASTKLAYGISQLLGNQRSTSSPVIVASGLSSSNRPCPALSIPVTDLNSLFCVPSFDSLYPDTSSSNVVASSQSSQVAAASKQPLYVDVDAALASPRTVDSRRRGYVVKNGSGTDLVSVSSLCQSMNSNGSSSNDKEWTVQSKGDCKVLLRRSVSQTAASSSSGVASDVPACALAVSPAFSKRRRLSASVTATSTVDSETVTCDGITVQETAMCYGCRQQIYTTQLSYCMAGHGCCGHCLQSQVKTLLASGKKGTLKCRYTACMSFYLVSQLHNSLPSMVVEILEEKLDREYCDNAAKLMLKAIGKDLLGAFSDDDSDDREGDHGGTAKPVNDESSNFLELPKTWEPMTNDEQYLLVELVRGGSEEYNWVAALFHETMTRPRAQIVAIKRVQNQILWQFYMVKKKQMERDSNRPVVEKSLFHGTCRNVVDSICRNNFDWRLCGAHGTMYGQGSYFARDAAYSHMYTDQPPSRPGGHHHGQATSAVFGVGPPPPSHQQLNGPLTPSSGSSTSAAAAAAATAAATQMLFQAFPGSSHAVSIAALHSCRFAHLQGTLLPTGPPHGPVGQPSSGYVPMPAYYFGPPTPSSSSTPLPTNSTTADNKPHVHCMFLARVLVGDCMTGKSSYRKPPPVDSSQPYGRCYDSCVNDLNNPTIFVIFNSSQCYPEYIIEYTNKPRDSVV